MRGRRKWVYLIKKLYAENVKLNKDEVTPVVKKEVVKTDALFQRSIYDFISLEYNTVLPTEEEATDYMNRVVDYRKEKIQNILSSNCISQSEKEEFLNLLASDSSCIYLEEGSIKPFKEVDKEELKLLKRK